ncbi:uncharacterized protein [Amphiura filiformis]|uniref:uncharacterized protein n=1 Tax=Amphiura filiformis TaxID=82378 RepID=UPI003B223F27
MKKVTKLAGEGACDGDSYIPFQNSCYKLSNERLNRPKAMSACASDGGHLADITSLEEQEFIVSILKASGGGDAWFGLLQYKFIWPDGSPLIPKTWHDIYTNEDAICMYLREESGYDWHDRLCVDYRYKYKSVCEFQGKCPNAFQNSCYKVLDESLTRTEAHRACTSDGGHLADITSLEEQEFIVSILKASGGGDAWFGLLKDPDAEESLVWSDGSPLIPETWQDIDTNENTICMRLRRFSGYGWGDMTCDEEIKFVCEIEDGILDTSAASPVTVISTTELTTAIGGGVAGALFIVILAFVTVLFIYRLKKKSSAEQANEQQGSGEHGEVAVYTEYKKTNDSDQAYEALQKNNTSHTSFNDIIKNNISDLVEPRHPESNESSEYAYAYSNSVPRPKSEVNIDSVYLTPMQTSDVQPDVYISEATHEENNESSEYAYAYADSVSQPECDDIIDHSYFSPTQTSAQPEAASVPVPQPKCEVNINSGYLTPMQIDGVQPGASIPEEKHPENDESLEYAYAYADSVPQPIQFGNSKTCLCQP